MKYSVAKSLRRILSWLDFEWRLFRLPKHQLPPPDVVVVSSLSLLTIVQGLFWRRRYKCRLVFEIRDIWPLTITEEGGFSPRNPLVLGLATVDNLEQALGNWLDHKAARDDGRSRWYEHYELRVAKVERAYGMAPQGGSA